MSKHTKAPWLRDGRTVYALTESTKRGKPRQVNRFVAQVNGGGPDGAPEEELEANAELMRAAPEILEMLEEVADHLYNLFEPDNQSPLYHRVRSFIAKVHGE